MSGIIQKAMGPLMIAGGALLSATGMGAAAGVPLAMGGLGQMTAPGGGGLIGGSPQTPQLTPQPTGYASATPIGGGSNIASFLGQTGGGQIAPTAYAAAGAPDAQSQAIAANMMQNSPFAAYDPGGYVAAA